MDILFYILIAIGGLVALFLILRLLGGCLLRLFLAFAALALVAFLIFYVITCSQGGGVLIVRPWVDYDWATAF